MLRQYLKNIAEAIRAKLGTTGKINAQDFADKVNEVYDKANLNAFKLFCESHYSTLTIPYGITKLRACVFYSSGHSKIIIPDTVTTMENSVFQNMTNLKLVRIPKSVKFGGANTWNGCTALHTLTFEDPTDYMMSTGNFNNCKALTTIIFEGGKLTKSWFFQQAPISVESMKHIINHLTDYSNDETNVNRYTVKFSENCWNALESDSVAPNGETWKEYVVKLGWLI